MRQNPKQSGGSAINGVGRVPERRAERDGVESWGAMPVGAGRHDLILGAHPGWRQTLTRHMVLMPTVATFVLAGFSSPPLREVCAFQDEHHQYTSCGPTHQPGGWSTCQLPESSGSAVLGGRFRKSWKNARSSPRHSSPRTPPTTSISRLRGFPLRMS